MPKLLPRADERNHLIATLSADDQALLQPHLTEVSLDQGMILEEPGKPIDQVVFPIIGVTSLIASGGPDGRSIEAGLFGRDGMSGIPVLLGAACTPNELRIQVSGYGLQISTERLVALLRQSSSLQGHFLKFAHTLLVQTTQTALSNKYASLEERLARWLLMCHDRVDGDRLVLTHQFISLMLGIRRAGVTVGTHILQEKKLIRARRGEISILDREGLEEEAKGSYGVPEAEYQRLFGNGRQSLQGY